MRIYEYVTPKHSGTDEVYTTGADLIAGVGCKTHVHLSGQPCGITLPLAEARRLARKILAIPTPVGFEDVKDV